MWDILPSDDERMIAESVREYLAAEMPLERLRPGAQPVDTGKAWREMAGLGWLSVGLPEAVGGGGLGLVAELLIQRECGRYLASPSLLATTVAGHLVVDSGDDSLASELAAGNVPVALATEAAPDVFAFDWDGTGPLLAWNDIGIGICAAYPFMQATEQPCFDDSLTLHVGRLGDKAMHGSRSPALRARVELLLAAALCGLAEHACDLAVDYAKLREQFGKAIGSFQAIKHRCADMAVRHRLAWYQTCLAALKLEAGASDAPLQVASAKLLAAEAAHENGRACVQIHGGIGFQAECDAHWFLKRARVYDQVGGAMNQQARRVSDFR